jgi:hypothetical protein
VAEAMELDGAGAQPRLKLFESVVVGARIVAARRSAF